MATLTSKRVLESSDSQHVLDVRNVLQDCCERQASCCFKLIHNGFVAPATFVSLHQDTVELQIAVDVDDESPLPRSITCVSFSYRSKFCAFLGCLIEVLPVQGGTQRVLASIPPQLVATNLRQSFRVPVIENSGLETLLQLANQSWRVVQARDIAETGIEIEYAGGDSPELKVGDAVLIELRFRDETVQKSGQIRRISPSRLGVAFDSTSNEHDTLGEGQLSRITLLLQQLWLKNRLKEF